MLRAAAILASGVLLLYSTPGRAVAQADGAGIVDQAIKAMGGEAKVAGLNHAVYRFKGLVKEGNNNAELHGTLSVRGKDQYRIELEISVNGQNQQMMFVLNGDQGWMSQMGKVEDAPKEVLSAIRQAFMTGRAATLLSLLKDKDTQLSPLGEVKVSDRATIGLKITRKAFRDFDLYFDKAAHLLVKCETKFMGPNNQEMELEYIFSEPKEISGLKHPSKMLLNIKADNKILVEFELVELKVDQKLEDGLFAKP